MSLNEAFYVLYRAFLVFGRCNTITITRRNYQSKKRHPELNMNKCKHEGFMSEFQQKIDFRLLNSSLHVFATIIFECQNHIHPNSMLNVEKTELPVKSEIVIWNFAGRIRSKSDLIFKWLFGERSTSQKWAKTLFSEHKSYRFFSTALNPGTFKKLRLWFLSAFISGHTVLSAGLR